MKLLTKILAMTMCVSMVSALAACGAKDTTDVGKAGSEVATSEPNENGKNTDGQATANDNDFIYVDNEFGFFTIGKDGAVAGNKLATADYTVDIYFDPLCGACLTLEELTAELISERLEQGNMSVTYHPLMFLSRYSVDDYSTRIAASAMAVAEYSPENARDYITKVLSPAFVPADASSDETPDDKIYDAMKEVGVSAAAIKNIKANMDKFQALAIAATDDFSTNEKYIELSPDDSPYTPFFIVNAAGDKSSQAMPFENKDILGDIEAAMDMAAKGQVPYPQEESAEELKSDSDNSEPVDIESANKDELVSDEENKEEVDTLG